jgi:hypothetical protein
MPFKENKQDLSSSSSSFALKAVLLASAIAAYGLLRKGNYRAALLLYKKGGGGLNLYHHPPEGPRTRLFAVDYHPFWSQQAKQIEWKLHYHRGKTSAEMRQHRPYEGGW